MLSPWPITSEKIFLIAASTPAPQFRSPGACFQHISSLQYVSRPAVRMEEGEFCNCEPTVGKNQKSCGDGCLNRELRVECTGMGKPSNEDGKKIVRLKYENCRSGPEVCSNRPFGRLRSQGVLTTVFREPGRGWGLQAAQDVSKGQLIHEYVGEVIDDVEMEERLLIQQRLKPYDHDHYLMVLNQGLYVDAKRKGNNSRFINHSCDPNCIVETWNGTQTAHFSLSFVPLPDADSPSPFSGRLHPHWCFCSPRYPSWDTSLLRLQILHQ
jgi:hypothetical protein